MSHCKTLSGEDCKILLNLDHLCFMLLLDGSLFTSPQDYIFIQNKPHWAIQSDTPWVSLTCFYSDRTGEFKAVCSIENSYKEKKKKTCKWHLRNQIN